MEALEKFISLFIEIWNKGILGIDIFQILIGLGIFLVFLLFRGIISKIIIRRLEKIAKKTSSTAAHDCHRNERLTVCWNGLFL